MNTFLNKIARLDSVQEVALLSNQGESLFFDQKKNTSGRGEKVFSYWNEIISDLGRPQTAEFAFSNGSYYLTHTNIGYLIIGLNDNKKLYKIKEACTTILEKLSDPILCKRVLLTLLSNSDDILKPNIIKELAPYADRDVAAVLISLLQKEKNFAPGTREKLLLLICQTLGYCSSYEAVGALQAFLSNHKTEEDTPSRQIIEAIRISKEQLTKSPPEDKTAVTPILRNQDKVEQKTTLNEGKNVSAPKPGEIPQINIPQRQQIDELLDKGMKDEAAALIMQLIESNAEKKQFDTADRLRDYLIKICPMALHEIIHAAELIEEAKLSSINKDHLGVWKDLIDILSGEEFSALYHAMILRSYANGKTIVQQGSSTRTLLFVNSGLVQIQVLNKQTIIPLSMKGAGEIIGAEIFFEASVWTSSADSLGCELFLLPRATLEALKEQHPSLEPKLSDFCSNLKATSRTLKKSSENRRQFERRNISGRMSFTVLNKSGAEISAEGKGNLIDISTGGVAFSIRSSQKQNASRLFGRQLKVCINTGIASQEVVRTGTVQAVRDLDLIGNEYSLHLQFSKQLSHLELRQIASKPVEDES